MDKKKWLSSGIALALVLGGSIYAYADGNNSEATAPTDQTQQAQPHDQAKKDKAEGKRDWKKDHGYRALQKVADVLGMKPEEVKAGLKSGKSIADLAQAKGIAEADVVAKLVADATERIDAAVKAGKLDQQKADQIKQNLPARITKMVERKGMPEKKQDGHGKAGKGVSGKADADGFHPGVDKMASLLGITADQLKAELKAGKSLADVAAEHNMSKDQLIAKIKDALTPQIDKFVTRTHKPNKSAATTSSAG